MQYLVYFDNLSDINSAITYPSPGVVYSEDKVITNYANYGMDGDYRIKTDGNNILLRNYFNLIMKYGIRQTIIKFPLLEKCGMKMKDV